MSSHKNNIITKRTIYKTCIHKSRELIQMGVQFALTKTKDEYDAIIPAKEEFARYARYLHRGYYCPSMVRDALIGNSSRGTIAKKRAKKYTHRYAYDTAGVMYIAESILPGLRGKKTEYLISTGDSVIGLAFDDYGTLVGLSEEVFNDNQVQSYFCASCYVQPNGPYNFGVNEILYEAYTSDLHGLTNVDYYYVSPYIEDSENDEEIDTLVGCLEFGFIREKKQLTGVILLSDDTEPRFTAQYKVPRLLNGRF